MAFSWSPDNPQPQRTGRYGHGWVCENTGPYHHPGLFEANSAAAIAEIPYTFGDYIEFQIFPVIPAQERAALIVKTQAWVDLGQDGIELWAVSTSQQ